MSAAVAHQRKLRLAALERDIIVLEQEIRDIESGKMDSQLPRLYDELFASAVEPVRQPPCVLVPTVQPLPTFAKPTPPQIPVTIRTVVPATAAVPAATVPAGDIKREPLSEPPFVFNSSAATASAPATTATPAKTSPRKAKSEASVATKGKEEKQKKATTKDESAEEKEEERDGETEEETKKEREAKEEAAVNGLRKGMEEVLRLAAKKDSEKWFEHAVTEEEVEGYSEAVKRAMDLGLLKRRLERGRYGWPQCKTAAEAGALFTRDLMLMFANALVFNTSGSEIHTTTVEIKKSSVKHLKEHGLWPVAQGQQQQQTRSRRGSSADAPPVSLPPPQPADDAEGETRAEDGEAENEADAPPKTASKSKRRSSTGTSHKSKKSHH